MARLNAWLRDHNRTALIAAGVSLLVGLAIWGLLYVGTYAAFVLLTSVSKSLQGATLEDAANLTRLRWLFPRVFLGCAAGLTVLAAIFVHWRALARWHADLPMLLRAPIDILLFPASMLVDGVDTLRALVWFRPSDRPLACALLARLDACGGRLAMGTLSQETPNRPRLLRVLERLHVAQVLETRSGPDEPHLCWRSREASERLAVRLG